MAKKHTVTVSSKGKSKVEVSLNLPENIEDPRWDEIITSRQDINDLALSAFVVRFQAGARSRLDAGPDAVQQYADNYRLGARAAFVPTLDSKTAKALKFSPEQLAALKAAGMSID